MSGENGKETARTMMFDGKSNDEILTKTHLPMGTITRMRGWMNSPYGKVWQENERQRRDKEQAAKNGPPPPPQDPPPAPPPAGSLQREPPGRLNGGGQAYDRQLNAGAQSALSNGLEQELMLAGAPLIRKIILNPKVYLWFDYARNLMQFRGDIGDFVFDCVEDFFKSRGYSVVIEKKEVTPIT